MASAATPAAAPAPLPPREMRWWGWGDAAHASAPPAHGLDWLRERIGGDGAAKRPPVALEDVRLRAPQLPAGFRERLVDLAGAEGVRDDRDARVLHAAGKSYPDLVRQRAGDAEQAPDAVVLPADAGAVAGVLRACAEAGVAVVPFGGGTSVVGGVEPLRGGFSAVVSLDLARLDGLLSVDERSQTAVVAAGTRGPVARGGARAPRPDARALPPELRVRDRRRLRRHPLGGPGVDGLRPHRRSRGRACAASRRPATLDLAARPPSAAGPDLRELLVGSEGTLGVLTSVALRVRPRPEVTRYEGFMLPSLAAGVEALRALAQQGLAPDVTRLSDETETQMSFALAGDGGLKGRLARGYLRFNDVEDGCLAIAGWEGDGERVRTRREEAAAVLAPVGRRRAGPGARARLGPRPLRGALPARRPARARRHGRDAGDRRAVVEACSTCTRRSATRCRPHAPLVACHVSHLYPTGASLYFTFLAAQQPGRELRAVARGEGRRQRRDRRRGRHDHPPPRGRARPRPVDARGGRRQRPRGPARGQGGARPSGHPQPRQAAARLISARRRSARRACGR